MREYISEYGKASADEISGLIAQYSGTFFAVYSDRFLCGNSFDNDIPHLMELRIFNDDGEFKLCRYDLKSDFRWRYISDTEFQKKLSNEKDDFLRNFGNRTFDEIHYLDIDDEKSSGISYVTTGGGKFSIPLENAERIMIRNYLDYDDNGILSVNDFRIVKLLAKGENYGKL